MLSAFFARLDLVTREEFDIQRQVLLRTREKLERLEAKLTEIEQRERGRDDVADHSSNHLTESRKKLHFAFDARFPRLLRLRGKIHAFGAPRGSPPAMTVRRYTATAITLHWLIALLVLCSATLGLYMVGLSLSPAKLKFYSWHKWIGVSIFLLAVLRVLWRLTHSAPAMPAATPRWQRVAAAASHLLLYLLIIVIPLSGWLMSSALGVQTVYLGVLPLPDLLAKDKALGEQLKLVHRIIELDAGSAGRNTCCGGAAAPFRRPR